MGHSIELQLTKQWDVAMVRIVAATSE